jgi:hypothetical protein
MGKVITMKSLTMLAFLLMSLLAIAVTACSEPSDGTPYENDKHGGYPGPGTMAPQNGT